ncbi:radial spoke head protein 4 homolog A-like [Centruroides sculpturatus]|uniref:radial spoke head protein 4 homolog A-like n=1 Tax=Centruroides sculpturatus TaxID=218467 RepID=UPI000C6D371D|nr:radial spoke head protein 4 homolog A-like [Centruroides sculpturatus]
MDSNQSTQLTKLVSDQSKISGSSSTKLKTISSGKQKSGHAKGKSLGKKDDKIKSFSTETTKMDKFQEVASIHQIPVEKQLSAAEQDYLQAKSYLMTASSLTNISVYDHLVELLRKLLSEKPINAVDALEDISENIKLRRLYSKGEYIELPTKILKVAQSYLQLLMKITIKNEDECGIGLSQEEYYHIYFSLIFLAKTRPIENVRFWGKIYGMINDYIIVEATLKNDAELSDMEDLMFKMKEQEEFPNINYPDDYTGPRDQYENLIPVQTGGDCSVEYQDTTVFD